MVDIEGQVSAILARIKLIEVSEFHKHLEVLKTFASEFESTSIEMKSVDKIVNDFPYRLGATPQITGTELRRELTRGSCSW